MRLDLASNPKSVDPSSPAPKDAGMEMRQALRGKPGQYCGPIRAQNPLLGEALIPLMQLVFGQCHLVTRSPILSCCGLTMTKAHSASASLAASSHPRDNHEPLSRKDPGHPEPLPSSFNLRVWGEQLSCQPPSPGRRLRDTPPHPWAWEAVVFPPCLRVPEDKSEAFYP